MKTWTVIASPSDICVDHVEAETAKDAMLKVLAENPDWLFADIIGVIEGKRHVHAPADFFDDMELTLAEYNAEVHP